MTDESGDGEHRPRLRRRQALGRTGARFPSRAGEAGLPEGVGHPDEAGLPLGVARVLIGDMADQGTLTVHRTLERLEPGTGPDRAVMARVLRGLRRL